MRSAYRLDLAGMVFGRWTVVGFSHKNERGEIYWSCTCSCGASKEVRGSELRAGTSQSCGCYHKEQVSSHRMTGLPTFKSWESMKQRCTNPNAPGYPNWGGRGITVCDSWLHSFDTFLADMGPRPKGTTLGRLDNDKGYSPENCAWVTPREQQRNRRNTRRYVYNGNLTPLHVLAELSGLPEKLIGDRITAGWTVEMAMSQPSRKQRSLLKEMLCTS